MLAKRKTIALVLSAVIGVGISYYAYSHRKVYRTFQMKWLVDETLSGKGVELTFVENPYWYIHADSTELAAYLSKMNKPVVTVTLYTRGEKIGNISDVAGFPGPFVIGIGNGCGRGNLGPCNSDNTFDDGTRPWRR